MVCYHKFDCYPARVHVETTVWENEEFAFHGDVVHDQVPFVNWNKDYFRQKVTVV